MPPTPRKTTPRKAPPRKPPVAGNDDFNEWQDKQPVLTVEREPGDESEYFPGDPDIPPPTVAEQQPKVKQPLGQRARGLFRGKAPAKPGRPKNTTPRVSVEKIIGTVWGIAAQVVGNVNLPMARTLALQAPVAGMVLEDTVKNTAIDRALQPLARLGDGGEVAFALLGPPLLVGAMTSDRIPPPARMAMRPILRQALRSWIEIAGPKLEEIAKKELAFEQQYGQRIDAMIDFILYGEEGPPDVSPNGSTADVSGSFTVS